MVKCEICDTTDDVRKTPIMTGVPFTAPDEQQGYICGECFGMWYECGLRTPKEILEARGLTEVREAALCAAMFHT